MWKASSIYKTISTSTGRQIAIGYASETEAWRRIQLADAVKERFATAMEKLKDTFRADTVEVVLKEPEHTSPSDNRTHYSVLELNGKKEVIASRHVVA
ncbi:hypothetical protein BST61_g1230 [Cercospora zeina]